ASPTPALGGPLRVGMGVGVPAADCCPAFPGTGFLTVGQVPLVGTIPVGYSLELSEARAIIEVTKSAWCPYWVTCCLTAGQPRKELSMPCVSRRYPLPVTTIGRLFRERHIRRQIPRCFRL